MTAAKKKDDYAFPPACLSPPAAAYYCGQLGLNAFEDEMRRHGVEAVRLTARRKGYLRADLDDYLAQKAGRGVASDPFVGRLRQGET